MRWKVFYPDGYYKIGYGKLINGEPEYVTTHSAANYPHADWVILEDGSWGKIKPLTFDGE